MWQSGSKAPAGTAEKCRNNEKKRDKMGAKVLYCFYEVFVNFV